MEKLKNFWYGPSGFQIGKAAATKLKEKFPELSKREIQHWLDRQPVYQIYKPKPKKIKFPHYNQSEPNHTHQVDLLFLPNDRKYKYALTVIDIASRYKEAEPLKTKQAENVAKAISKIYERSELKFPTKIMADNGHEFMGSFNTLMKSHDVKIVRSLNKKKVAFVERFNKTLSEKLFAHQYAEEIKTKVTNREWVDRLPGVIESLNSQETRMIGMKPIDAIKKETVKQPEYEAIPEDLSIDDLVRFLYKPGEAENDTRYRATDPIWSTYVYGIYEKRPQKNQPSLYTLQGDDQNPDAHPEIKDRTFTKEQLQVVPPDTEFLPAV